MKLSIDTLKSDYTEEEWKIIDDYMEWVKKELLFPSKPEISIGTARYPLGRFRIKRGVILKFKLRLEKEKRKRPKLTDYYQRMIDALSNIELIIKDVKQKGKSVKSTKRKKLNESQTYTK